MSSKKGEIARCGACRFYAPVGRRGGECSQLSVPVQSGWKACCLVESPFKELTKISESDIHTLTKEPIKTLVREPMSMEALPVTTSRFPSKSVPQPLEPSQAC